MPIDPYVQQMVSQMQAAMSQQVQGQLNQFAASLRREQAQIQAQQSAAMSKNLEHLAAIAGALEINRSSTGIVRIEDLPGRRVPYDMLVDIPIGNNTTSIREASVTISQEGPFVATARFAAFQSSFEFQVAGEGGALARFVGRSFGRYRPIHSVGDVCDASNNDNFLTMQVPFPANTSVVGMSGLTSSQSGFRTMQFDGRILVENAGSSFPRQNISVPSPFWTKDLVSPQDLAALDFYERGEVITFRIQPTHINNPPAGNANGLSIFGTTGWPFLDGQYDKHEGIVTPAAFSTNGEDPPDLTRLTDDPITRLPDGILTLGFLGYRIQQPIGPLG